MSLIFADIYEAIQNLRIQKGVSEKDILNYVEERVGGCLKAANFMKTIRTLQKLVDDGVLIKKGRRFMFSTCPSNADEEDAENEEDVKMDDNECDDQDDGNEENDCDEGDDDDDNDDDEDEEEDDEDDDEDDDDDEGEDDDDECDDKEANSKTEKEKQGEEGRQRPVAEEKFILSPNKTNGDGSGKTDDFGNGVKCVKSKDKDDVKNNGRLTNKEARSAIEQKGDVKGKEGETIAFCVRDFIDSLYRPKSDCHDAERLEKFCDDERLPHENMDATETGKRERSRGKRRMPSLCSHRSRSPIKNIKVEKYYCLKKDDSDKFCFRSVSNQFLQEPMDEDVNADLEKDPEVIAVDPEASRYRSSASPLVLGTPGIHLERQKSSCSDQESKKVDPCSEGDNEFASKKNMQAKLLQMAGDPNGRGNWFSLDSMKKRHEKLKRSLSVEDERSANEDERASLCSVCQKKKINVIN